MYNWTLHRVHLHGAGKTEGIDRRAQLHLQTSNRATPVPARVIQADSRYTKMGSCRVNDVISGSNSSSAALCLQCPKHSHLQRVPAHPECSFPRILKKSNVLRSFENASDRSTSLFEKGGAFGTNSCHVEVHHAGCVTRSSGPGTIARGAFSKPEHIRVCSHCRVIQTRVRDAPIV